MWLGEKSSRSLARLRALDSSASLLRLSHQLCFFSFCSFAPSRGIAHFPFYRSPCTVCIPSSIAPSFYSAVRPYGASHTTWVANLLRAAANDRHFRSARSLQICGPCVAGISGAQHSPMHLPRLLWLPSPLLLANTIGLSKGTRPHRFHERIVKAFVAVLCYPCVL